MKDYITMLAAPCRNRIRRLRLLGVIACAALIVPVVATPADASARAHPAALSKARVHRIEKASARHMLALLNAERRHHGRRPLRMNRHLIRSAHVHNRHMAQHDVLSHQLRGERFFAARIRRAGYRWRCAGENVGVNWDLRVDSVLVNERMMFRERPPENGHRVNILNRSYRDIGIDVYVDRKHHKVWFTQDIAEHA